MPANQDQVFSLIQAEKKRQTEVIDLIPSENHASPAVHQAVGSILMHKYAEGYPKKRYYQGNAEVDQVEQLCRDRALEAFGLSTDDWGVNVQAYSGSGANLAVYNALLEPGDTIMAMYLPDGGHLSHGWGFKEFKTFVKKVFKIEYYHVDPEAEVFDYDQILEQAKLVRPKLVISGGTAYPREINHAKMGSIAQAVGAFYHADIAHEGGLVAAGVNASPFAHADTVMLTTHKTLRGPRGALIFGRKQNRVEAKAEESGRDDLANLIDRSIFPGMQGGPHLHSIAGIAVALQEAMRPAFKTYAQQILDNAKVLAKAFDQAGYRVVSGNVEKHLILLDMRGSDVEPWIVAWALEYAGIVLNRNTVPNDDGSPYYPSGIRLGTPIVTTRGMKQPEMTKIADWILQVFDHSKQWQLPQNKTERRAFLKSFKKNVATDKKLKQIKKEVSAFAKQWPLFQE